VLCVKSKKAFLSFLRKAQRSRFSAKLGIPT
jgi:hypothetical protein